MYNVMNAYLDKVGKPIEQKKLSIEDILAIINNEYVPFGENPDDKFDEGEKEMSI
jgi:hypothetical protein